MKIAFDVHPLLSNNKSGIGYCEYGFLKTLLKDYPNNYYFMEYFGKSKNNTKIENLFQNKNSYKIHNCSFFRNSVYKIIYNTLPIQYRWFFKEKVDLTHFFNYHIPPGVNGKKIVTVHDMAYKRFPETVRFKTRTMLDLNLKKSVSRADLIITVSEFSKQEILSFFPECEGKIEVVYNGVDLNMFRPISDQVMIENIKQKYNLKGDFLLYLGTIEPRKNIERLLEAYSLLKNRSIDCPKLVLAGGKGWLDSGIFSTLENLNLKDSVVFTGYISDDDVPVLMNASQAFLFPSLYEGFGMPVLEAMACGVPVLTSNLSSLPEVVGDTAVLVDPFSKDSIRDGIIKLLTDNNLRESLKKKGLERSRKFSWSKVTRDLYMIYESLVK